MKSAAKLDASALEGWLWDAACQIRGPLDAPKFKDYILPLIFVKRLSDVLDDEVAHLAKDFGNQETAAKLVEEDHKLVRFYIPEKARWTKIATTTTGLPADRWGQEEEVVRLGRYADQFLATGHNAADWYYSSAGLGMTGATGVCDGATCDVGGTDTCLGGPNNGAGCVDDEDCGVCTAGDIGAACDSNGDCSQSLGLDTTQLSVGRSRRDIANQTQAANIDIPVICLGGSNGNTSVPADFLGFAQSIGTCASPSCDSTPRVVDDMLPNPAFPTFGDVDGGFEVHISEGYAHQDVTVAEDDARNNVLGPLSDFIARNVQ